MAFQEIELNMIPHGDKPSFYASQYETGRPIIINVKMGEDDFACTDLFIELHARKVDDNIVTLEPDSVDGNQVVFVGTDQLFACPGKNLAELCLYVDDAKDTSLGSLNFFIEVEPDPMAGGLTSETQIYDLYEQVEEITQQVIGDDYYDKTEVDDLLDLKADKSTTYTKTEVDNALNLKADKSTTYTKTQTDNLLNDKADKSTTYTKTQTDNLLNDKADKSTTYTKTQTDNLLNDKADKATTYTKTQVDNALALKANASDLATVATTGDYDDLTNKPTIPAAQVQSDYAQDDNTKVDYIKNKPDLSVFVTSDALSEIIYDLLPAGTASGAIANFDTDLSLPLVDCKANIVATGGNGTPDNPNPINGYTEANITRCGVNLWDEEWEVGTLNASGEPTTSFTNCIRSKNYDICKGSTEYYLRSSLTEGGNNNIYYAKVAFYDSAKAFISSTWCNNHTVTSPANACYFKIATNTASYVYGDTYLDDITFAYPSTDTAYHPYNGQIFTIAFGQTVYGGVLDVTRGKLKPCIEYPSYNGETLSGRWLSSEATYIEGTTPPTGSQVVSLDDYGTDIDLTPVQINALLGVNNVYNDTNGDTEVKYKDGIQHYVDTRI